MKYIVKNNDLRKEDVFYENEVEKARKYWGVEEECDTIEDVAMYFNKHHSGDAEGEMLVKEINI